MKRRTMIRIVSFSLCLAAIALGFAVNAHFEARKYKWQVDYTYMSAFSQLLSGVSKLDGALQKGAYAASPSMCALLSAEVWKEAAAAKNVMGLLPVSEVSLEDAHKFIAQSGEYAYTLLKKSAAGETLSEEERGNIQSLAETADALARKLKEIKTEIDNGDTTMEKLKESLSLKFSGGDQAVVADEGASGDAPDHEKKDNNSQGDFPAYATLIYDGPFSEHIEKMAPALLEGEKEICKEEAQQIAADLACVSADSLTEECGSDGKIKTWCFAADSEEGRIEVEVTKQGGHLLNYTNSRIVRQPAMEPEKAVEAGREFLTRIGYKDMKESYYTVENDIVTVNFAYTSGGVIYYPDLIKVSVALDTGDIVSAETFGYVMSHKNRDLPAPKVSEAEAKETIDKNLTPLSYSLAVIPTEGKNEVFCHEFKCKTPKDTHVIVYVNAETGREESIFLLIEDENGTLTL